jgi:isocitrate dehydrogenase
VSIKNPNNGKEIIVKDVIADAMLQQILTRPRSTRRGYAEPERRLPLRRPGRAGRRHRYRAGRNLSDTVALFEATHGTAPKYAVRTRSTRLPDPVGGDDAAPPGLERGGGPIIDGMNGAIQAGTVTYDFERLMDGATLVSCSGFGAAVIDSM